jgi:hypothetical protein
LANAGFKIDITEKGTGPLVSRLASASLRSNAE